MAENLYDILGVSRTASKDDIRKAYRKLARKHHPDVNPGDQEAEATFKRVAAAHDVLADDERRAAYDEFGEESLAGGFDADKARDYKRWSESRSRGASAVGRDDGGFDFADLFGWRGGASVPLRGGDVRATVDMTFNQAVTGGEVTLGTPGGKPTTVRIPPGADDGSTIRIKGRGAPGVGGGPAGDLLIVTRVAPHPHLKRKGLNLHMTVQVSLDEAYNGASIEVPTLSGSAMLRIPRLSQPGAKLRLAGKGIERKGKRGNMIVTLSVRLPDRFSETLSAAIKEAAGDYERPIKREVSL